MRKFIALLVFLFCAPGLAVAAQIFGNLKQDNRSVGQGVEISINCGGRAQQAFTDAYGAYSVYVPNSGRCSLTVNDGKAGRSHPYTVLSSEEPTRYDFDLIRNPDGSLSLRRR